MWRTVQVHTDATTLWRGGGMSMAAVGRQALEVRFLVGEEHFKIPTLQPSALLSVVGFRGERRVVSGLRYGRFHGIVVGL